MRARFGFAALALAALAACSAAPNNSRSSGQGNQGGAAVGGGGAAGTGTGSAGVGAFGNTDASAPTASAGVAAPKPSGHDADGGTLVRDDSCGKIVAIVRDFTPDTNPDFEMPFDLTNWLATLSGQGQKGIVKPMLEHGYPAYAPAGATPLTHGPQQFYQWYVDTPNVNIHLEVPLTLTEDMPGHFIYDSAAFFPIDNMGFGNYMNTGHNFHFTTEVRTKFTYQGGEAFTFRGDDDVWLFVNGVLAIDLGGLHGPLSGSVDMDTFAAQNGLKKGQTYSMDIFQAERHTTGSNFHIETTIDCFTVVKPPPPPPPPPPPT